MSTETDILSQLEELWESAEPGAFEADDSIIIAFQARRAYEVRSEAGYRIGSPGIPAVRVLERAEKPEPKPRVVVASDIDDPAHERQVFTYRPGRGHDDWESIDYETCADDLVDPVELVEVPGRADLRRALLDASGLDGTWPGIEPLADAVFELLEGKA